MVRKKFKKPRKNNPPSANKNEFTGDLGEKIPLVLEKIVQVKKEVREGNADLDKWNVLLDLHALLFLIENEKDENVIALEIQKDSFYFSLQEYFLGYDYFKDGELDHAKKHLEKSLEILNTNLLSHYLLGNLYFVEKKFEQAKNAYRTGLNCCGEGSIEILSNLGMTLMKIQKFEESKEVFFKALEIDDKNSFILNNLGLLNELIGNHEKALLYYKKAVCADPKDRELWYNYGNLLGKVGQKEERLFCFIKAEDLGFTAVTEIIEDLVKQGVKPECPLD